MHCKSVISLHFTWLDSGQWALESTFRSGDGKYTEAVGIQNREIQTLVVGNGWTGLKMVGNVGKSLLPDFQANFVTC